MRASVVGRMSSAARYKIPLPPPVLGALVAMENFLQRKGFWLLALASVLYYTAYYDTGLSLTGERGSNVLIAQRLLAGERPFVDLFPGYNLLWFYPMTAVYAVVGPHWLATRIYFLVIAVVTALMGYSLVRRVTGQAWLALLAGVFMVLIPGAIFRNYMGFIGFAPPCCCCGPTFSSREVPADRSHGWSWPARDWLFASFCASSPAC